MTPRAALDLGLAELQLTLPDTARAQLMNYVTLLAKWNRTYNLTAIDDPLRMVSHHLLDSLVVVPHLPMSGEGRLADAGSGAGLPGIPLAVARPQWQIVLVEASEKKSAFLRQAVLELGLRNVEVHHGRVEKWQPAARFAVVVSRAFAELARFIGACRHLVAPGGVLAAMKGLLPRAELEHLPGGCDCSQVIELRTPQVDAARHLVLCRVEA
ncbi:MAG: rRNA (guanine527-N7)-methyltransferase [Betaproteobacteria bacterium]|jgi:16S rRNA (guanine527-N7)-methyltransferase|nr:rRNA (guanine527-N7)-methyltransferase [Betaproteobacteria bacterium]